MLTLLWSLVTSRLGGWVAGGVAVLVLLGLLKWEYEAKLKAQAAQASAQQGLSIGYEGYVKLYQERERLAAAAAKRRKQLHDLQTAHDLDGLSDLLNHPDGVRQELPANPPGGPAGPAGGKGAGAPGPTYQDGQGHTYQ